MAKQKRQIPVEVYSRVVGYFRPLQNWNPGKTEEFSERVTYKIDEEELKSNEENSD